MASSLLFSFDLKHNNSALDHPFDLRHISGLSICTTFDYPSSSMYNSWQQLTESRVFSFIQILYKINKYQQNKTVIIFNSDRFLKQLITVNHTHQPYTIPYKTYLVVQKSENGFSNYYLNLQENSVSRLKTFDYVKHKTNTGPFPIAT